MLGGAAWLVAKGTGQREGGRAPTRSGRPPGGAPWPSRARRPASRKPRPVGSATVMTVHLERTHARIHKRIRKYGDRLRICGSLGGYSPRARQPGMRHKSSVAAFAFLFNLGFVLAPHSCIYTNDYHTCMHACISTALPTAGSFPRGPTHASKMDVS